jgi:hypothetical protein
VIGDECGLKFFDYEGYGDECGGVVVILWWLGWFWWWLWFVVDEKSGGVMVAIGVTTFF